ncbi:hypothetical protein Arub01_46890 [Actinomadura rubrobrunea]|uniref:Uncharacterized protein n=1 Tax=Actinomadura rubrobrunea TaxID=115335 RepID=A0A9W6PXY3_9ACTN|nr:hypothetical protein Arub01_46890 [Actinomadura rubrobrunea]
MATAGNSSSKTVTPSGTAPAAGPDALPRPVRGAFEGGAAEADEDGAGEDGAGEKDCTRGGCDAAEETPAQ